VDEIGCPEKASGAMSLVGSKGLKTRDRRGESKTALERKGRYDYTLSLLGPGVNVEGERYGSLMAGEVEDGA